MPVDEAILSVVRESLLVAMKVSAPVLGAGILIGLLISILQSVTQIQEQTLTIVPKIFVMLVVALLLLPWIVAKLVEFSGRMFMLS